MGTGVSILAIIVFVILPLGCIAAWNTGTLEQGAGFIHD